MEGSNKKPDDDDKSIQSYAALGVGFVCLVIGLPLWWKTTEVYRVQLPYDEVAELASSPLTYAVEVQIVDFNADGIDNLISHFRDRLKSNLETSGHPEFGLDVKYDIYVRTGLDAEKRAVNEAKNLEELEVELDRIVGLRQNGNYSIYLLPGTSKLLTTASSSLGRGRSAFVLTTRDEDSLLPLIEHIIRDVFVNEATILRGYVSARGAVHMQADKESMRGLRSYPGYEVTFTLLNPQPDMVRISWDIEDAIQRYLKPLLNAFAEYANIKIKSQFLHQAGLGVAAHKDTVNGGFFLAHTQLPHIINPIEAYLGSHVSNNPNLNFLVYIPTRDQSPLIIRDSSGNPSASNAFLSPRWGGLLIYNVDPLPANASLPVPVDIDMKKVMSVFASQLRLLLGIRPKTARDDVSLVNAGDQLITDWELDLWLREHCIQNIVTSAMTLQSLTDLLDKIGNIVINDEIGKQVDSAVNFIGKSKDYLQRAKLKDAFLFAQKAMQASEAAFFDPSLLQLLYFPQDQKFAIYIPLFLPVGIPIVLSVLQAIKWMTRRQKEKKE